MPELLPPLLALLLTSSPLAAQGKPNIVWLMAEDISADLSCYGMPDVRTPNLDALAAKGVRFENCFWELEEKRLADNTSLIFIGDNGRCNVRGKGYLHDPGLRIPLIIYDPRDAGARPRVQAEVISATDITATILAYAGAELPAYHQERTTSALPAHAGRGRNRLREGREVVPGAPTITTGE